MNIADHLRRNARTMADRPALSCGETTLSWVQLDQRVNRLSGYFLSRLKSGDRVVIFANNCHRYFEVYLACARAGLVCVPVNSRLLGHELAAIISDAGAQMLVLDGSLAAEGRRAVHSLSAALTVVGFGEHGADTDYEESMRIHPAGGIDANTRPDDPSIIAFTSGTTGRPKGATLTNLACVMSAYSYALYMKLAADDTFLACMPAYVYRGGSSGMAPIIVGAETVVTKFRPDRVLDLIEQQKVTHVTLAPAMILMLLAESGIDSRDLSSLRQLWTGGAPIHPDTLDRLHGLVGEIIGSQYGMTEATGIAMHRFRRGDSDRLMSVGRPSSHHDVRIVRADGIDAKGTEVGEIWVRGPVVTTGYWNAPEVDAAAFDGGWFKTGDMARQDADGYLYLLDRRVDIINSGGLNVYTVEVERVLSSHAQVAETVVFGVPDQKYGETVMALVVALPGAPVSEADLQSWCREQLAGFKVPRHVGFIDMLPRNAMGKIKKAEIRAEYWRGSDRVVG